MAARPPTGDDGDEPETIAFGIATLDARLDDADVRFPATDEEIRQALAGAEIPYDARGRTIAIEEALAAVDESEYDSQNELLDALYPVFDARRADTGMLGQLRAILPF
ncbi:hypothetical protein SAMN06269185_0965 [Natronoarchaeum philippinense]|uniref:Uncharacterized protein n=1 Tax=Natronoarchaeum philippinense TaxID=558529 RepID=A0A285NDW8_NATPI|nr:hypothetical protein [Natronoarchaeum philippinense]SNZ05851.1 hypothetical protein SAMN06269185_0965 [Natronoarchaeum philippinense]